MRALKQMAVVMLVLSLLTACGRQIPEAPEVSAEWLDAVTIQLYENGEIGVNAGTEEMSCAITTAHDIVYYEEGGDFTYGEGTEEDSHSAEEAAAHTVVHITRPGTYVLQGTLDKGQIAVDLGEEAKEDPDAVVTLILNGVDITCTVAPAIIFYNVYECGSADPETAKKDVDTSAAGANVILADGTANTVTGSYVARIYKPDSVELNEDGTEVLDAKKLHKYDAAFYSRMSMNVNGGEEGSGTLYINAENEGLDSELHLTINGGNIDIRSGNDGINTNEDGVSVTTVNGGNLTITVTGETGEGDGIDSNGWLVINGGSVVAAACGHSMDSGIDSDMGIHINGGTVMASGYMLDRIEDGGQNYAVFSFAESQKGGTEYTLKPEDGHMLASYTPANEFSVLLVSDAALTAGDYSLWQGEAQTGIQLAGSVGGMMGGPGMGGMMAPPEDFDSSQLPEMPEGMGHPEGVKPPEVEGPLDGKGRYEGMERGEDGIITLPDGTEVDFETGTVTLPDGSTVQVDDVGGPGGMGGFPGRGDRPTGEQSAVFSISDGGVSFSRVAPTK